MRQHFKVHLCLVISSDAPTQIPVLVSMQFWWYRFILISLQMPIPTDTLYEVILMEAIKTLLRPFEKPAISVSVWVCIMLKRLANPFRRLFLMNTICIPKYWYWIGITHFLPKKHWHQHWCWCITSDQLLKHFDYTCTFMALSVIANFVCCVLQCTHTLGMFKLCQICTQEFYKLRILLNSTAKSFKQWCIMNNFLAMVIWLPNWLDVSSGISKC